VEEEKEESPEKLKSQTEIKSELSTITKSTERKKEKKK
jgi:hypothetical protein